MTFPLPTRNPFSFFQLSAVQNGCFHNGDCVGATCFCYRGWTGRDCSKYHCNNMHNCSGNGRCVGPNVCKCSPGYLVRMHVFYFLHVKRRRYHQNELGTERFNLQWFFNRVEAVPTRTVRSFEAVRLVPKILFCGWCDSAQRCMPGNAFGSSSEQCPDWFYYNCYTIGSVNHCSNQIQVHCLCELAYR